MLENCEFVKFSFRQKYPAYGTQSGNVCALALCDAPNNLFCETRDLFFRSCLYTAIRRFLCTVCCFVNYFQRDPKKDHFFTGELEYINCCHGAFCLRIIAVFHAPCLLHGI